MIKPAHAAGLVFGLSIMHSSFWFAQTEIGFDIGSGDNVIARTDSRPDADMIVRALKLAASLAVQHDVDYGPDRKQTTNFVNAYLNEAREAVGDLRE